MEEMGPSASAQLGRHLGKMLKEALEATVEGPLPFPRWS